MAKATWTVQEIIDEGSYARVQNGCDEARFLDVSQMESKAWFSDRIQATGAISACNDFEDLMKYISVAGMPADYDTVVLFQGSYQGPGEDSELGEVLVTPTAIEHIIKIEDIVDFDEYLDNLLGW